jgi:lysozyme
LKDSTLLKRLNAGAYAEVPRQLRRWSFADGKQVQGLLNRRENEIKLWNGDL